MTECFNDFYLDAGQALNEDERALYGIMEKMAQQYATVCIPPQPKQDVASLKNIMKGCHPEVLRDFTRCCVETNTFVPIEDIVIGKWKDDFSYMQRFGMWYGTGFKGIHAYGKEFIEEALNKSIPVTPHGLWKYHSWMQVKDFSVEKVYNASIEESKRNPKKISLWNSKDEQAQWFVTAYALRKTFPPVMETEERSVEFVKVKSGDIKAYISLKAAGRERN